MVALEPRFKSGKLGGVGLGVREGDLVGEVIAGDFLVVEVGGAGGAFFGAEDEEGVVGVRGVGGGGRLGG